MTDVSIDSSPVSVSAPTIQIDVPALPSLQTFIPEPTAKPALSCRSGRPRTCLHSLSNGQLTRNVHRPDHSSGRGWPQRSARQPMGQLGQLGGGGGGSGGSQAGNAGAEHL
jgi:hypothetical protein